MKITNYEKFSIHHYGAKHKIENLQAYLNAKRAWEYQQKTIDEVQGNLEVAISALKEIRSYQNTDTVIANVCDKVLEYIGLEAKHFTRGDRIKVKNNSRFYKGTTGVVEFVEPDDSGKIWVLRDESPNVVSFYRHELEVENNDQQK